MSAPVDISALVPEDMIAASKSPGRDVVLDGEPFHVRAARRLSASRGVVLYLAEVRDDGRLGPQSSRLVPFGVPLQLAAWDRFR